MSAAVTPVETTGPIGPAELQQVAEADARARPVRKAAAVAGFNGWATAILAACSAPFALFSMAGAFIAAGLALVAYNELKGRRRLLRFDPQAAGLLGWNQLGLLGLIVVYCLWMTAIGLAPGNSLEAQLKAQPELGVAFDSLGDLDHVYRLAIVAFYGTVVAVSVVFQGLTAWYYFSRRRHVLDCVERTPDWALELQRLRPV